ncbi:T9SS type B sorting domain-containing protein [Flavobacterium sp.]|jgi:gliding motility-associated-like protein|uniref:T9SS type B sorting domain-containing protein n=1 Tax=Flavobacterium sp. TaxID=239 RepID=UPI0037C10F4B
MKKKFSLLLALFFIALSYSQGEANIWYFGDHAGLDFNNGNPVALTDGQISTIEGCATISNSNGQLLFYTDGITVWDRSHTVMTNGTGLLGDSSSSQSAIIVPKPGSNTIYYIITVSAEASPNGVTYSIVDLSLNGTYGAVTTDKNVQLFAAPACEKLTVVKKGNDTDYWVVIHGYGNNTFLAYSITSSGLNPIPVISNVGSLIDVVFETLGYLKFSPDGTKLISCNYQDLVELFDFDNNTGIISNPRLITNKFGNYGVEFSPSGDIAYISTGDLNTCELIQYDLTATNIPSTAILLYSFNDINQNIGALQLAPDGKIYIPITYSNYVNRINNPNILGLGCNFQLNAISLGSGICILGLPQFIQSYFNASFTAQNFCLGSTTQFTLNASSAPTSVLWDFGDGFTSTDINPTHQYSSAGSYTVTVTVASTSGTTNKNGQITISGVPVIAHTVSNQSICGNVNQNYDLSQFNNTILGSQSTSTYGVAYFSSLTNAQNHSSVLNNLQNLPLGTTTFYAKTYNLANNSCYAITSFSITLNQQPIANTLTDYLICENLPYNTIEQFNLATKNSQILGTQSSSNFTISYHTSQSDADNDIAQLPFLYTNTLQQETLYVRIENNLNQNCFATTTLLIKVIQQPTVNTVTDYKVCDDNLNDGIASFDLNTKTSEILNGQSSTIFLVKYYSNYANALNEISPINTSINYNSSNQTIYYSISNIGNPNCKSVGDFKLVVNRLPIANTPNPFFLCDDLSNDGLAVFNLSNQNSTILANQSASTFTISYHLNQSDANNNLNQLPLNYQNSSNPQMIYVRVENNQNTTCFATTSFQIGVNKMPIANSVLNMESCDDDTNDTFELFNLSSNNSTVLGSQLATDFNISYHLNQNDANSNSNPLPPNYQNMSNPQTIYVRIENKNAPSCYSTTSFQLIVRAKPILNMNDVYSICQGSFIVVTAPSGFTTYTWSNGATSQATTLTQDGSYSLVVTKDYGNIICNTIKNFTVYNSNIATITNITTTDWTDNENIITINVTGDGDYEYSLDNINFQSSNQFIGLWSGQYNVYVRDKKGCGTATDEVFLLMYPKFFTPNGDGYNDFWRIKFSEMEPNLKTKIYDRFGKFIKELDNINSVWDGTYNGNLLTSDDYWFVVTRSNGKQCKGHFAMKR